MRVVHHGDEEVDAGQPLLRDDDSYSLSSLDENGVRARGHYETKPYSAKTYKQHRIQAIFPKTQSFPLKVLEKYAPSRWRKALILSLVLGLWTLYFLFLVRRSTSIPAVPGYGVPRRLTCHSNLFSNTVERFSVPSCDTSATDCIPINPPFAFQCPPDCGEARLQEEHYLGDQFIEHEIWVIGGHDNGEAETGRSGYRADSYICGAAIHAGVIEDKYGGCGTLTMNAGQDFFSGSSANGIESMDFNSSFPLSFMLEKVNESGSRCYKLEWTPFTISVLLTVAISLFTKSPEVFFFLVFTIVFFQTALISDPPNYDEYVRVVQTALARFLPAMFVGFAIYKFAARKTLAGLDAQIEKTILWLGGCWFGALNNYTLDKLPLSRLTPRDLAEPGAIIVLICVVGAIVTAAGTQAWAFWRDGRFWKYLTIYLALIASLLILAFVPGLNLRIHHYILALLLLPGTAIQTRPSLLFQGFLVGLFINGIARWDFASILETDRFLAREGQLGSIMPEFAAPIISGDKNQIAFTFSSLSPDWDGISVMVNDAERTKLGRPAQGEALFSWSRSRVEDIYFRFAYFKMGYIDGVMMGDYTKPGTWYGNGTWTSLGAN